MIGPRRMEKAREEKEEPYPIGYPVWPGIRLEQNEDGWLGSGTKPNPEKHSH